MKKIFIILASLLLFYGCASQTKMSSQEGGIEMASHDGAMVKQHFEGSMAALTDNGLYSVELVIPAKQLRMGVNTVEVIVHHGSGGDVPGAIVSVSPWMPGMGHGVMEKPVVTERGGGLYSIENVVLSMTGHWQLVVSIEKDGREDSVTFEFPDVMAMGHDHHIMSAPAPADLDASTEKMSENKLFHVSYQGMNKMIMVNRIHTWKVTVKRPDGVPVKNAHLTIVGDMPEHGHGLPTQPVVSPGGVAGEYLIEGMKFSMPGWWVITFNIKSGAMQDSVTFNLQLH